MTAPPPEHRTYWLDNPRNSDKIYWAVIALCAILFLADSFHEKHPKFEAENLFGFYGVFAFIACVGLVLVTRLLRRFLKRPEAYYSSGTEDDGSGD